jgi:hypothetical protein
MQKIYEMQLAFFELPGVKTAIPYLYRMAVSISIMMVDDAAILSMAFI